MRAFQCRGARHEAPCGPGVHGYRPAARKAPGASRPSRAPRLVCGAARGPKLPPEDEAAWRGEQPWWSVDGPPLIPPKHRPQGQPEDDWRAMRAKLVAMERAGALVAGPAPPGARARPPSRGQGAASAAVGFTPSSWAHELPAPEVGCLLVAKQPGMDFFDGTVVLIAAHDDTQGSIGFVLNRASPLRLSEVTVSGGKGDIAAVTDVFGGQRLRVGGPVHMDTLTVLHGYAGCQGAQKVSEGVYFGGLLAAADMVRSGLASPSDFRLLLGLAGWAPQQLSAEIASGVWYCVAASKSLVMAPEGAGEALRRQIIGLIGRQHGERARP